MHLHSYAQSTKSPFACKTCTSGNNHYAPEIAIIEARFWHAKLRVMPNLHREPQHIVVRRDLLAIASFIAKNCVPKSTFSRLSNIIMRDPTSECMCRAAAKICRRRCERMTRNRFTSSTVSGLPTSSPSPTRHDRRARPTGSGWFAVSWSRAGTQSMASSL